ncbi:MAG: hypothetical protein LBG07_00100 [Treponema sp.]|nr:hypothetical protein [Treponema sp.]
MKRIARSGAGAGCAQIHKFNCTGILQALLFLLPALSLPLGAVEPEADIQRGIACHERAVTVPENNIEEGKAILYPYINGYPLAKGYYGSFLTLESAGHARRNNMLQATSLLDEGTALIDEAVRSAPDLVDLRVLRMINSYEISSHSPFDRYGIMKTDMDWLEARRNQFMASLLGILELYKGLYCLKNRRITAALAAFEACIRVSPGSQEAREAERQLQRYGE